MPKEVSPVPGEALRYWVQSSESLPHFVDLSENDGNGECSCPDFRFRCLPNYRDQTRIIHHGYPNATRCKHIKTAMLYFADEVLHQCLARERAAHADVPRRVDADPDFQRQLQSLRDLPSPAGERGEAVGGDRDGGEQPDYDWTQG